MKRYFSQIGRRIKARRIYVGMTLPQLAVKAGISKGNLSKIENEPCNIGLETLWKLSKAMKVTIKELLS